MCDIYVQEQVGGSLRPFGKDACFLNFCEFGIASRMGLGRDEMDLACAKLPMMV